MQCIDFFRGDGALLLTEHGEQQMQLDAFQRARCKMQLVQEIPWWQVF